MRSHPMRTAHACVDDALRLCDELREIRKTALALPIDAIERWSLSVRAGAIAIELKQLAEEYRRAAHENRHVS